MASRPAQGESAPSLESVLAAASSSEFVARWIALRSASRKLTYAAVAKRAGFASRSFPRDVAVGRRKLTSTSVEPMIKGLGLEGDPARLLRLLVQLESEPKAATAGELQRKLQRLRQHAGGRSAGKGAVRKLAYLSGRVPSVFAALGTADQGATVEQIVARTGFAAAEIDVDLRAMARAGLVERRGSRHHATATHIDLAGLHDRLFQNYLETHLQRGRQLVRNGGLKDVNKLFIASSFSVKRAALPKLRQALRKHLTAFLEEVEDPDGDHVATVLLTLV